MAADKSNDDQDYSIPDPQRLARNLAKVAERSAGLLASVTRPETVKSFEEQVGEDLGEAARTFGKVAQAWFADPQRLMEANWSLLETQFRLWQTTMRKFLGEEVEPVAEPGPGDRRFQDEEWRANAVFDFIKQSYLLSSAWAQRMVDEAEDLDPHTRHKAGFYVRQLANALAPTNFVLTNPQVLRETLRTSGENLVKGIDNLAEDLARGHGDLRVRQTDLDAFRVGDNLAVSPGKVIFQNDLCQLIQYAPTTVEVYRTPLLIVPPWINKFYILDLTPEKSFVAWAVGQGHTVFVISWVNPDEHLAAKTFEDYMREGILASLDVVLEIAKADRANIAGYCVGGTLLAATLAYMAARHDDRIESATLLTTQVDFTHAGDLMVFVDEDQLEALERRIARHGYLEGASMARTFNLLRSNDLIWSYVVNNYLLGHDPFPFDLLYWNSDSTRMPAANHLYYLRQCYLENRLAKREMVLAGETIDVGKVKVPIYNLSTREDHIAPAASVFIGGKLFGGPVRFVLAGSGHIAGVINPPDKHKYQYWANGAGETLEDWIATATETPGSWWPDWQRWIEPLAGDRVKARKPGRGKFKAIEDAPGSFVKLRAD